MNRRTVLALLGTSTTAAVAGCLGSGDDDSNGDDAGATNGDDTGGANGDDTGGADTNGEDDTGNGTGDDENGDPAEPSFELAFIDVPNEGIAGEEVTVGYRIENVGNAEGTTEIVFEVLGTVIDSETVTLERGEDATGTFGYAVDEEQTESVALTVTADDATADAELAVTEPAALPVTIRSTGGFVSIRGETRAEAIEFSELLPPASSEGEPILIDGEITDGEWESTAVEFPEMTVAGLAVDVSAPDGFAGSIDPNTGEMTLEGTWLLATGSGEVALNVVATTGESGALEGSFDLASNPPTATLVENEAAIDAIGVDEIDEQLDLPVESGEVWLELDVELEGIGAVPSVSLTDVQDVVVAGEEATVEYQLENIGDRSETFELVVSVDGEDVATEELAVDGGDSVTGTFSHEVALDRVDALEMQVSSEDSVVTATIPVQPRTLIIESTGGFGGFGGDTREEAEQADFSTEMPPDGGADGPIRIEAEIREGRWVSTDVDFPDFTIQGIPISTEAPDGLEGDLVPDEGLMTFEGIWAFDVGSGSTAADFEATTRTSGALEGSFDLDADPPTATVVSNEQPIEASGVDVLDEQIGLPLEPGQAWLELDLTLDGVGAVPLVELTDVPEFVEVGSDATVEYLVENAGDTGRTFEVIVEVDGEERERADMTLDGGDATTRSFSYPVDSNREEPLSVTVRTGDSLATADIDVQQPTVTIESVGGFLSLDGETREEAMEGGMSQALPPSETVPDPVEIEAELDGTRWNSTEVVFPDITISGISVEVAAPNGLEGEFDREAELMTFEGVLTFDIGPGETTATLAATTGESGALEGAFDFETDPPTATVVDNESVAKPFGVEVVDNQLGLPLDPGDLWMELDVIVDGIDAFLD